VAAFASLSGLPVTPQLVDSALADLLPRRNEVHLDNVLQSVSEVFGVTIDRILGRDRSQDVALPRQIAMYLLREEANYSLPQIGDALGGRDHTTVMYACDKLRIYWARQTAPAVTSREQIFGHPGRRPCNLP
jgi:chromosomal replication initiator protein